MYTFNKLLNYRSERKISVNIFSSEEDTIHVFNIIPEKVYELR